MIKNPKFMKLLVSEGLIVEQVAQYLSERYQDDASAVLGHLVRTSASNKNRLGQIWGDSLGVAYMDLRTSLFQRPVVQLLPEEFCRKHQMILVYQFGDAVTAAVANPLDAHVLKQAREILGKPISAVFSFPDDIEAAIEVEFKTDDYLKDLSRKIVTDTIRIEDISELTKDELKSIAGDRAVVEFAHGLLLMALRERASDIHIEPGEEKVKVRFRMDGVLQEKSRLEKSLLPPLISRLKILASLDITERRRPLDGRINLKLPNRSVDFRFSSIPTIHGEKVVLRLLGQAQALDVPDLADLSFAKGNLDILKKIMDIPHGIFFVTGPTGCGKTTTLFSMLKHLNKPGINITTIEDPVEYKLDGTSQVQVNAAVELDFASALRSFLRQDPDVMLVGEIRDFETAQIACQAAHTGHLVLATLHTNNALQAVTRLVDIGVKPFIVAPSLIGIMAQRLVRKICENCKEAYTASKDDVRHLFLWEGREISLYRGKGCAHCANTGYLGRIAIHEMLPITEEIRGLISRGESLSAIHSTARRSGFQTMRYDGVKKALRGLTTLEEVTRVTTADEDLVAASE